MTSPVDQGFLADINLFFQKNDLSKDCGHLFFLPLPIYVARGDDKRKNDVCRGTCDWCGGDGNREKIAKDLLKLSAARAGSGWMGVRNPGAGTGVGAGGAGGGRGAPGEEGGWDAKRYYRLAGDDGDYEGGSDDEDQVNDVHPFS